MGIELATFARSFVSYIRIEATPDVAAIHIVLSATLDSFINVDGNQPPSVLAGAARVVREARPVVVAGVRHGATAAAVETMPAQAGYVGRPLGGAFNTWMSD